MNRSNNKEWFYIPIEKAWQIFCQTLSTASGLYGTEIHAFVLMSNHYHLLLSTPGENLDQFMRYFQTETCREIQRRADRINHVFGARYKWSALWTSSSYAIAFKYVLRNPVAAEICRQVELYRFSSLFESLRPPLSLPISERIDSISSQVPKWMDDRLRWLNLESSKETDDLVRRALRRSEFTLPRGNEHRLKMERFENIYGVRFAPATFQA